MERAVWQRWTLAWLGGPLIGIANGSLRESCYQDKLGEMRAHQVSTVTAVAAFAGYFALLQRRFPIPTRATAVAIGGTWVGLTTLFEFGFGHFVARRSWSGLLADYDLTSGRAWALVLIWLGVGPEAIRRLGPST